MGNFSFSDPEIDAILYGISSIESKGAKDQYSAKNPDTKAFGKYQFMPDTWSLWSRKMTGDFFDSPSVLSMSADNQELVARYKVASLLNEGKSPEQVASIWYTGSPNRSGGVGINQKYGNAYNVPKYINDFKSLYGEASKVLSGTTEAHAADQSEWEAFNQDDWEAISLDSDTSSDWEPVSESESSTTKFAKSAAGLGLDMIGLGAGAAAGLMTGPNAVYASPIAAGIGYSAAQRAKDILGLSEPPKSTTEALTKPVSDAATGAMLEMGGQVLSRAIIDPAIAAVKGLGNLPSSLVKRWMGPIAKSPVTGEAPQNILADMADIGMNPELATAGMVTANKATQGAESALSKMPGGAGIIQDRIGLVLDSIKGASDRILRRISQSTPATETELGTIAVSGAERSKAAWQNQSQKIYGNIERLYGNLRGESTATQKALNDILGHSPGAVPLDDATRAMILKNLPTPVRNILESSAGGQLNYKSLSYNRTQLQRFMDDPLSYTTGTVEEAQLAALRDGITQDMKTTLQSYGGPYQKQLALSRLEKADAWYSEQKEIHNAIQNFLKSADAEKVGEKLANPSRFTSEDAGRMKSVYSRSDWTQVASGILGLMGKAKPGVQNVPGDVFSASTFLTRWNTMAPETKQVLFADIENGKVLQSLNKLANVVGSLKDLASMTNTSNTAPVGLWMRLFGSIGRAPIAIAGTGAVTGHLAEGLMLGAGAGISPYYCAKLMTDPKFVSWLSDTGLALGRTAMAPQTATIKVMRDSLARLGSMKLSPDLRNPVKGFLEGIREGVPLPAVSNEEEPNP